MGWPFVQDTLIELSAHMRTHARAPHSQRHTNSLRHADKSFLTCDSGVRPRTLSLRIYRCINCSELNTREGQQKRHWELETPESTSQGGEVRHRSCSQRDGETHTQRQESDIELSLRGLVLVPTRSYSTSWIHYVTQMKKHTHKHTAARFFYLSLSFTLTTKSQQQQQPGLCGWGVLGSMHFCECVLGEDMCLLSLLFCSSSCYYFLTAQCVSKYVRLNAHVFVSCF